MQCVAGIHYNFSLADSTLAFLMPDFTQDEKSDLYLDLIRNFKRNFWFILRIMGSSPMIDKTFVEKRDHGLSQIYMNSLYEENATSLRMSNIGYQSAVQSNLNIKYNSLTEFIDALGIGISEGFKPFKSWVFMIKTMKGNKFQMVFFKSKMSYMTQFAQKEKGIRTETY